MINDLIAIGNDTTVCQSCVEKIAQKKAITRTKAARDLYGKFTGKKMVHIGNIMICDKCLKKFHDELFGAQAKGELKN